MNNIALDIDVRAPPLPVREMRFDFLDLGASGNLGVNGAPLVLSPEARVAQLSSAGGGGAPPRRPGAVD